MRLEMKNIVMEFGPVCAVNNVDLAVNPGEIVGLLGENGAGKSTLMNVLAGVYTPVSGRILIDGNEVTMRGVRTASQYGIRFIHQELNLCNDLRVYENMFLGEEPKKLGVFLRQNEMIARCEEVFARMKVKIDPSTVVGRLSAAEKQLVEIAKALLFKAELIIMDEPFVGLDPKASHLLKGMMREVCDNGGAIFFSTPVLEVAEKLCEKVAIIKGGRLIRSGTIEEVKGDDSLEEVFLELEGE